MANWRKVRLGDLGEVNRGRSRHRPRDAAHLYGGPYPFIQTGDIRASNGRITQHFQTYSVAGLAQSRLWPSNTMVITIAANIAETAILTYPACFPDSVVGFIADPNKADAPFLEYLFRLLRRQIQHENVGTGSVQDNINLQTLERLEFLVPSLPEQQLIASVLSELDDKIDLNRRMNETLEAMARGIFRDWFVDFGPTYAQLEGQKPYLAPDLWPLFPKVIDNEGKPLGWSVLPLDEMAEFLNGLALQKFPGTSDGDLPVIKIAELRSGVTAKSDWATNAVPKDYIVSDGDVLFSWSGSLIQKIWTGGSAALNQHLFKVSSTCFPKWLHYFWVDHHLRDFQAIAASKATTMGHIQRHHLSEAETVIGTEPVMKAADELIAPLFERLIANDLESRTLAQTRDLLLPKLMSGEVRLKDAEKALAEVA